MLSALMMTSCASSATGIKLPDRPASLMVQPARPDISLADDASLKDVLLGTAELVEYADTLQSKHQALSDWVENLYK